MSTMSTPASPNVQGPPRTSYWQHLRHVVSENPVTGLAFGLFALFIGMALFGPYLVPFDPLDTGVGEALKPPSPSHWFGTDHLGRDVFSRVVVATRLDLLISVSAVAISFVLGSAMGAFAGYFGGWTDRITGRLVDTIMAFPLFVLAMGIVAAAGNTVENIVYATAIINLPFGQGGGQHPPECGFRAGGEAVRQL